MKTLFNEVAEKFSVDIDSSIDKGNYIRGQLFLGLAEREIPKNGYVLDYGCGPGRLSILLARSGFKIRGVDTSEGMITQAQRLDQHGLNIEFEIIKKFDDVMQPNTYDAVVCSSVIEYVENPDELLQGFHKSLRKSGVIIISYANSSSYWRRKWKKSNTENPMAASQHHVWDWQGFKALLARNGFCAVTKPKFFESPLDNHSWGTLFRGVPFTGSLGVVVARPISSPQS